MSVLFYSKNLKEALTWGLLSCPPLVRSHYYNIESRLFLLRFAEKQVFDTKICHKRRKLILSQNSTVMGLLDLCNWSCSHSTQLGHNLGPLICHYLAGGHHFNIEDTCFLSVLLPPERGWTVVRIILLSFSQFHEFMAILFFSKNLKEALSWGLYYVVLWRGGHYY